MKNAARPLTTHCPLLTLLLFALAASAGSPLPPEAALAAFTLADPDLKIELVAAEPQTADPIGMAFDENGRIYVVEMGDYPLDPGGGRIRLLETGENGRVTRGIVFADKLPYPAGVCPHKGGVFVTAAPDIYYLKDTDGDGRADVREVVFTGFKEGNQQHRINTPTFALDGWIYCGNGGSGGTIFRVVNGKQAGEGLNINGQDFRFRPDTFAFEGVPGQAQYAQTFDAWGNRFVNSNSRHIDHAVLLPTFGKRNPNLPTPPVSGNIAAHGASSEVFPTSKIIKRFNDPWAAGHFTSACAVTIYQGDALPPKYRGQAFCCEPVHNLVHLDLLEPSGVTFIAKRAWPDKEFLASSDGWCRMAGLANAPDGALYIADMYRKVIEHPEYIIGRKDSQLSADEIATLDVHPGNNIGRIYRIVPKTFRQPPRPALGRAGTRELVAQLSKPNIWWRMTAQRLLIERQARDAIAPLRELVRSGASPHGRLHALWTLQNLGGINVETLQTALHDAEPRVRENALRIAAWAGADILGALMPLANDPDCCVRFQLALTLAELTAQSSQPPPAILATLAAQSPGDAWIRFAVLSAIPQTAEPLLAALLADSTFMANPAAPDWARELAGLIGARKDSAEVVRVINQIVSINVASSAPWQVQAFAGLGEGLRRGGGRLDQFLKQGDLGPRVAHYFSNAIATALAADREEAARLKAIDLLSYAPFSTASRPLQELLLARQPTAIQIAAVRGIGRQRDASVPGILLAGWRRFSPQVRVAVCDTLLLQAERAIALLDAIERDDIRATELDAQRRDQLARYPNRAIRERAEKLLAATAPSERAPIIATFQPALALKGDFDRGRIVFGKVCVNCHRLEGKGNVLGPDLTTVRQRPNDQLIIDILDPNRMVQPTYVQYNLETKSEEMLSGILASESATSITLRRAEAQETVVLRRDIVEMRSSGVSLMPEGLEQGLTPQDIADLMLYVKTAAP